MIVRILNEGQWTLQDSALAELNELDDSVSAAVDTGDQALLGTALQSLLQKVRALGEPLPDDSLDDSDLILPSVDATVAEVQQLLVESEEGLIPG